jgi:citrate lyase subunit beta/citryl-CoA lyase
MNLPARSLLFVPGDRPERYAKALASGADQVIVDLEDAVAPSAKEAARAALAEALRNSPSLLVRINGADTPWYSDDVRLCVDTPPAAIVLPKAQDPARIDTLAARLSGATPIVALIETALGMHRVHEIASCRGVNRLAFGSIDLQLDLGMDAHEEELESFRLQLVLASRVACLAAPVDGVTTAFNDAAPVLADSLRARRLGFGGKLCIHPAQVAIVNEGFLPSDAERRWAEQVVRAARDAGGGAVALSGGMLDKPVIEKALAVLRCAEAGAGNSR